MAEEVEAEEGGLRSQLWKHEAMVEWINEAEGVDLDTLSAAEVIAYAFARRVAWRQSDTYRELVAEHATNIEAEREAKAQERAEAKAAKDAEKAAAKAAEAAKADTAKSTPAAKKAASTTKPVAKATKKATKATAKAGSGDSPFG